MQVSSSGPDTIWFQHDSRLEHHHADRRSRAAHFRFRAGTRLCRRSLPRHPHLAVLIAGIVAASDPASELRETATKMMTFTAVLGELADPPAIGLQIPDPPTANAVGRPTPAA